MTIFELSEVQARRQELRQDVGVTTATRDAVARSFHAKNVQAVGVVEDVIGRDNELTVLMSVGGEVLTCPLERVHGRGMDETIGEVRSWRKADRVKVTGKLNWPSFDAELAIGITGAEKDGDGSGDP